MARIMTRRKAIPKAIELLQCLPQTEEVVEVIQALKKYSSTPLDRWDAASVYGKETSDNCLWGWIRTILY